MPYAIQGVALTVTVQATVRTGTADPTAGTIDMAIRKWKQGDGEDGYYYTGSAWQAGAATVTSTQGDLHAHTAVVDATRMGSLQGFDLEARPADAAAIGPATWYHVGSDQLGDILAAILADTATLPADPASETNVDANETKIDALQTDLTAVKGKTDNLPTDPADQSLLMAEHATTQNDIAALNDLSQADILDDATPFSGADIAAILTDTNEIQGKLPSGDIAGEPTGSRAIVVHTQEADTTVIPQAAVSIWADSGHTNLVTRLTTDVSGNASVSLDDGTYYYTAVKSTYTFVASSFAVSADATHNVTGVSVSPASPSSPDLCVVYGTVLDGSGDPIASADVRAHVVMPATSGGNQISREEVSTTTNSSGYFELELVRAAVVRFSIPTAEIEDEYTVPSEASQDITTWAANS